MLLSFVAQILLGPDLLIPIDYTDAAGNTILQIACQNGNKRIAKLCLRRGANINHQNVRPATDVSLYLSALSTCLLCFDRPPPLPHHTRHRPVFLCHQLNGQTVLHYAYAYGFEDLARYLMDKGADDSLKNGSGLTCYEGLTLEDVENI